MTSTPHESRELDHEQLVGLVNPHVAHRVVAAPVHTIRRLPARSLLCPRRFDVLAKVPYVVSRIRGIGADWATDLYLASQRAVGGFVEGDGSGKIGVDAFLTEFDRVIDSIRSQGFDPGTSVVPVDASGALIDGAHRVAACIALEQDVWVTTISGKCGDLRAETLGSRGLDDSYLEYMATEYVRRDADARLVCLFPRSVERHQRSEAIAAEYGTVVYDRTVSMEGFGPRNLIAQLYRDEPWLGSATDGWPGAQGDAKSRFMLGEPTRLLVITGLGGTDVLRMKERIRAECGVGNYSVHVTDTHDETVRLCQQLFNPGSRHLLNSGDLAFSPRTLRLHREFQNAAIEQGTSMEDVCIDGSSILALYGLREANDYDFLSIDASLALEEAEFDSHAGHAQHHRHSVDRLITDPRLFLWFDGTKYLTLDSLRAMKLNRSTPKDLEDVGLIEASSTGHRLPPKSQATRGPAPGGAEAIKVVVRRVVPRPIRSAVYRLRTILGAARRRLRGSRDLFVRAPECEYRGFRLRYPAGDSLVEHVRDGGMYSTDVTGALLRILAGRASGAILLDVGANIGLMSLNLLSLAPSLRVHAFEPSPEPARCLRETVALNDLGDRLKVHEVALSNRSGTAAFAQHRRRHSSGDGFVDTRRAGRTREISVEAITLDAWWEAAGRPVIHAVKLDTEGSELWVLEGARTLIEVERPSIVFEIAAVNLRSYPHGPADIESFLEEVGYGLRTLIGTRIPVGELYKFLSVAHDFVASPDEA